MVLVAPGLDCFEAVMFRDKEGLWCFSTVQSWSFSEQTTDTSGFLFHKNLE